MNGPIQWLVKNFALEDLEGRLNSLSKRGYEIVRMDPLHDPLFGETYVVIAKLVKDLSIGDTIFDVRKQAMESAIKKSKGNITQAAKALGITRSTFYRNVREWGIPVNGNESIGKL